MNSAIHKLAIQCSFMTIPHLGIFFRFVLGEKNRERIEKLVNDMKTNAVKAKKWAACYDCMKDFVQDSFEESLPCEEYPCIFCLEINKNRK